MTHTIFIFASSARPDLRQRLMRLDSYGVDDSNVTWSACLLKIS